MLNLLHRKIVISDNIHQNCQDKIIFKPKYTFSKEIVIIIAYTIVHNIIFEFCFYSVILANGVNEKFLF